MTADARLRSRKKNGFSLVEVVLAIGIVAFAFLPLLGLLPLGMNTFREAAQTTVGSQIAQRIINEAKMTDFPVLIASGSALRYFDEQGSEVSGIERSIYTVDVGVTTPVSPSLATLRIKIANNPEHEPSPFGSGKTACYAAMIAKNQ